MTDSKVLVSSSEIDGTITSSGIQAEVLLKVTRKYPWSLIEYKEYVSYNIVKKEIIKTYTVPSFTPFAVLTPLGFVMAFCFFGMAYCVTNPFADFC